MTRFPHREAMTSPAPNWPHWRWTLLALATAAYAVFARLGGFPLLSPDEGRNAEVAREMGAAGAWLVPTYDGATYLDKPAFFFRAVALSLDAFGSTEAAARLPSALSAFALLLLLFAFCRRIYDGRTATLAVLTVATMPLFMAFSRIVIFDMMLGLFVSAAILAAYLAEECRGTARTRWYLAAAAAAGIATLVKGPVGFLVPLLVMAAFHGSLRQTDAIRRFFRPAHWLVFLALVLPWFIGLSLACPDFPYYGIMKESLARFATPAFKRTQPFYFYALIIAGCCFGWSLLLPEAVTRAVQGRRGWSRPDRLFIVWAVVVVIFFSLSQSKLPGYILTGVVALGVLTARLFAEALDAPAAAAAGTVRRANLGLLLVLLLLTLVVTVAAFRPDLMESWLRPRGVEIYRTLRDHLPTLALSLVLMSLLSGAAAWRGNLRLAFAAFLGVPLLLLSLNGGLLRNYAETRSGRELARIVAVRAGPDAELACLECLPNGLAFYTQRLVTVLSQDGKELTSNYVLFSLASGQRWPQRIVPVADAAQWLAQRSQPVFLMAKNHQRERLDELAAAHGLKSVPLDRDYHGVLITPRSLAER